MPELHIFINQQPARAELEEYFDQIASLHSADTVFLEIDTQVDDRLSPLLFDRICHLIITWGRSNARTVLRLAVQANRSAGDVQSLLEKSDVMLLAAGFATTVTDVTGQPVTEEELDAIDWLIEQRNALHDGGKSGTILLPYHLPRLNRSPDLHAQTAGEWGIDESARTLYHVLWPEDENLSSLRMPWGHLPEGRGVTRKAVPYIYREKSAGGDRRRTLGEQVYSPRGEARQRVLGYRVRSKSPEDELGEVLFEVMQNTERHGLRPSTGYSGRAFRLLRFEEWVVSQSTLIELEESDPAVARYVRGLLQFDSANSSSSKDSVVLAALTIIDSGIGLARSAAKNQGEEHLLRPDTEVNYLRQALEFNSRASGNAMGNIGLPRVQLLLSNLFGFMRIRTGSVEITRDFIGRPYKQNLRGEPLVGSQFVQWIPFDSNDFVVGEHIGTSLSMLLPVQFGEEN